MSVSASSPPLSLAHLCELEVPPVALIAMAAAAGFASVGLRTAPAVPGGTVYRLDTKAEQTEVLKLIRDTGTSVAAVELIGLGADTRPADHHAMLEIGAAIGARNVVVVGDSADHAVVAEKLAGIAEIARPLGLTVELEFMPFRPIATFADALSVLELAGVENARILVDALHVSRSRTPLEEIAAAPPGRIGTFQLCDAPATIPPADQLVAEARTRRLLAGDGGLDLAGLMNVLPADVAVSVEVPMAAIAPDLDPMARLTLLGARSRAYFNRSPKP